MLGGLKKRWDRRWFEWGTRFIHSAAPINTRPGGVEIVTQLTHADVTLYLLALHSFYPKLGEGGVTILNDGSLTAEDQRLLRQKIPTAQILPINQIPTGSCPAGGTWERLVKIIDLTSSRYVIQMDADTLAVGPVDEVLRCYRENRSFTLGTRSGQKFLTLRQSSDLVRQAQSTHIQVLAERTMEKLPDPDNRLYVRGSSGFAGFSKGAHRWAAMEEFSQAMESHLGTRWHEWGTEQVTSSYMVANAPDSMVLPYPRYACFDPEMDVRKAVFLHFIGPHRFYEGVYRSYGSKLLGEIGRG